MSLSRYFRALIAAGVLFCTQAAQTANPYSFESEANPGEPGQIARDRARRTTLVNQEKHRLRVAIPHAVGEEVQRTSTAALPAPARPPQPSFLETNRDVLHIVFALFLVGALVARVLVRYREESEIRALSGGYLSDGTEVARFKMPDLFAPVSVAQSHETFEPTMSSGAVLNDREQRKPADDFFAEAPEQLALMRDLLKVVTAESGFEQAKSSFKRLHEIVGGIQRRARAVGCHPAWQMASALDLLIKRVADKPKDANASVVRTIAAAVDVLADVCVAGVRPDLITEPPVKLLAVDDDPLCRRSVQFALEKAHLTPDLADDGEQAVALASKTMYDVVFMDIMMPKMDGLTACERIHEIEMNAGTPVIFVTALSDFNTRAQSVLKGGSDLMAKPYLVLELTVKAMTYAMRGRLDSSWQARREAAAPKPSEVPEAVVTVQAVPAEPCVVTASSVDLSALQGDFFADAPKDITVVRKMVEELRAAPDAAALHERIEAIYLKVHSIAARAGLAGLPVAARLSAVLEALLTKLYGNPNAMTTSALNTVENALRLLESLCKRDVDDKLASHPPVRTLVADDEPLARRAIMGALQLAFDKPDGAESGAEACVLAAQKPYDVIFTDVQMPLMDGFAVCRDVRAGRTNRDTPIVVITSHNDDTNQARAFETGANDFIGKPFLPIEIAVKALTLAWEARLRNLAVTSTAASNESAPAETGSDAAPATEMAPA